MHMNVFYNLNKKSREKYPRVNKEMEWNNRIVKTVHSDLFSIVQISPLAEYSLERFTVLVIILDTVEISDSKFLLA